MARFDVHAGRDGSQLLLDVQADYLSGLDTRLIVPLRRLAVAPKPAGRLNPAFDIGGATYVMFTQYAAAVRVRDLDRIVASLQGDADRIRDALDMLLIGV